MTLSPLAGAQRPSDWLVEAEELGSGFRRVRRKIRSDSDNYHLDGVVLYDSLVPCSSDGATVQWVRPFAWDVQESGFAQHARSLQVGETVTLVAGPYAVADAAAWNSGVHPRFDTVPASRAKRYIAAGVPPIDGDEYQDACGWVAVSLGKRTGTLVLAWEYSGTVVVRLMRESPDGFSVTVALPSGLYTRAIPAGRDLELPAVIEGRLQSEAGESVRALQALVRERYVRPLPTLVRESGAFPYVLANTWALRERIEQADVIRRMREAASLGVEVFVVDKGWERSVGDWHPNGAFPGGLRSLSSAARDVGLQLGLWCAFGNADPRSPVARDNPEWLAVWRGEIPAMSFGTHAICLGHEPAREWALEEVDRLVREGELAWLVHDFETIARCDNVHHTHDLGGGEASSVAGLWIILDELHRRHPNLLLENCWNGGRPIDLGMVARHDTSIGDDLCRALSNRIAKVGLGQFLPLDRCTAYMGDEEKPPRYQIASYLLGGPWVLMGDFDQWDDARRSAVLRGVGIYRRWRGIFGAADLYPLVTPSHDATEPDVIQAVDGDSGRSLIVVARHTGSRPAMVVIHPRGLRPTTDYRLVDEWSGDERVIGSEELSEGFVASLEPGPDARVFGLSPASLR